MHLTDNLVNLETIPPFDEELSVQEIAVDCIIPSAYPMDFISLGENHNCWELGPVLRG